MSHLASMMRALQGWAACDYIVITMKARLVRIGNSRGVRLPKAVIDQAELDDVVELEVENQRVIISASRPRRDGWTEAARDLAAASRGLLDPLTPTRFDESEWRW
jgi:antitoxin MazE